MLILEGSIMLFARPGAALKRGAFFTFGAALGLTAVPLTAHAATGSDPGSVTIEQIQGSGATSPLAGTTVTTSGVVTASYPTGGFNGFYLQTPGTGGHVDLRRHHASDAVFVYLGAAHASSAPAIGAHVQVSGEVSEYHGLTELDASDVAPVDTPASVRPARVAWPRGDARRESLEGMLLDPQGAYTVSDNYSTNQYAEIGLAHGTTALPEPTDVVDPHDTAAIASVEAHNAGRLVTLDDGSSANYLTSAKNTPLPYLTQDPRSGSASRCTSAPRWSSTTATICGSCSRRHR